MSDECQPSLLILFLVIPFGLRSTQIRLTPFEPALGSVFTTRIIKSPYNPFVMNVLDPLITYSLPLSSALV